MGVTVGANQLTLVHGGSNGLTTAFPDVCKTPAPPAPPIPIPYPNLAQSSDLASGSSTVKADGNPIALKGSNFACSSGNEAGALMGVASNKVKGKAEFVNASFDVKVEGQGVARAFDPMLHNGKNTPPFPVLQAPLPALTAPVEQKCFICGKDL